jgi:hypothetical protein
VKQGITFPFSGKMTEFTQIEENYNKHDSEWTATGFKLGISGI